jgi:hypothetical protein
MFCEHCGEWFDPEEGLENVPEWLHESFIARRKYCSKKCKAAAVGKAWYSIPANAASVIARVVRGRQK